MPITREEITNLQRIALEGAKSIATTLDVDARSSDADLDRLITKCYTWSTALRNRRRHMTADAAGGAARGADKSRGAVALAQPIPESAFTPS